MSAARCIHPRCSSSCWMCNEAVPDPLDAILADEHTAQSSKQALSTPAAFLKPQQKAFLVAADRRHKERRQFSEEPVTPSAFQVFA